MAAPAANSLDDKLKRLQDARKKAEEISQRKQRVAGELDGHKKRLAELEKKCTDEYGCEVKELPNLIKQLEEEAEKSIAEAERILNPPAAPEQKPDETEEDETIIQPKPAVLATVQAKQAMQSKMPVPPRAPFPKKPVSPAEDEDVL